MQIRQLEHFEAVYRLRSFTLAATDRHLTQSALSRSIRSLEDTLGQRLFDRSTHTVEPTPLADALIAHALDVLSATRSIAEAASSFDRGITGQVRIGTGPYPAHPLLSSVVRTLSGTHPALQVALVGGSSGDLLGALVGRELDFVVCDTSKPEESPYADDISVLPLPPEPLVFVAGVEHPLTTTVPTAAELAKCPWVLPPVAPLGRRRLPKAFAGLRRSEFPFYEMETTTACLEVTRDQRSITLVPLSVARVECAPRGLCYRLAGVNQRTNDGIHMLKGRTSSASAARAIELIRRQAQTLADEAGQQGSTAAREWTFPADHTGLSDRTARPD